MKGMIRLMSLLLVAGTLAGTVPTAEAQGVLGRIRNKAKETLERKVEEKVEAKADSLIEREADRVATDAVNAAVGNVGTGEQGGNAEGLPHQNSRL